MPTKFSKEDLIMIRRSISLFTLLALLLCAGALAEQPAAYEPGKATLALFDEALKPNVLFATDLQFKLSGNPESLGMTGRYAEQFDAIASLSDAKVTLAAGQIDNGVRIELAAHDAATNVGADAALNITYDGLLAETSLLPGESVSIRWETLLALLGVPQEQAASILAMRDLDMAAVMELVNEQSAPMIEMSAQSLAPYIKTITDFIGTLPMEMRKDVPAEGHYPAAATEVVYAVCWNDVGTLLNLLTSQLEKDFMFYTILDNALSQQDDLPQSAKELCELLHQAADSMNNTEYPVYLYMGYDENHAPLYTSIIWEAPDSTLLLLEFVHTTDEATGVSQLYVDLGTRDVEGNVVDNFNFTISYLIDALDPKICNIYLLSSFFEAGNQLFLMEYALNSEAFVTAENLSGYSANHALAFSAGSGENPVGIELDAMTQKAPTAAGGEYYLANGNLILNNFGDLEKFARFPVAFTHELTTTPGSDGPVTVYTEKNSSVEFDLENAGEILTLYTKPYDPAKTAALNCMMLETASEDDVNNLVDRLTANALALEETLPEGLLYFLWYVF